MIRSLSAVSLLALASVALAQTSASGSLAYIQNGASFTYDITLKNTGTTPIGTLWYAWIPGEDYLPVKPTATASPAGWKLAIIDSTAAGEGYSLQWQVDTSVPGTPLAAGSVLDGFTFTTTTSPIELAGNARFGSKPQVGTTFVYQGAPFVGGSSRIVINPTPEPGAFAALGLGSLALLRRRRR